MMSDNVVSHLTSDDDDDTSKDLMTFCMQLIHHSQWKSSRRFWCGSSIENKNFASIVVDTDLSCDTLDIDILGYNNTRHAFNRSISLPETFTGDIIRIYTDDVHTGYVRLIDEKDNKEVLLVNLFQLIKDDQTRHGPAVMENAKRLFISEVYSLSNVQADKFMAEKRHITLCDLVPAVHSPYWPVEATEWITRRRSHGFPSKSVIEQVVRYGCDFVQVSYNRLSNDGEWRFSFSRAELVITQSWSKSQRIVYGILWVLNKKIANSKICSYFLKTLMFWACEEKPAQFWNDDLLYQSICELFIEMMMGVKSKFCVNYFIPGNNMMDHLIDTDLSYEIDALWRTSQSRQLITEVVKFCQERELQSATILNHLDCPAWIKRAFVLSQRINNKYDNYTDLSRTDLTTDLQNALYVELSDIYRGLYFQQESVNCVNVSNKHIYLLKSESHLLLAVNLCESLDCDGIQVCNEICELIMAAFMHYNSDEASEENVELNNKLTSTADRWDSLNIHNEKKCLLYNRCVEKYDNPNNYYWFEKTSGSRNVNIEAYTIGVNGPFLAILKEWPGRSPTVNISWFIAKAYLANLYYTTQHDVSLTIKTCDDIIEVYRQSQMNSVFAEKTFPVVLSTQWTSIYDKEIQEMLGFYSLCSYVLDASSRAVYLGVCPVQFALYFKVRIEFDLRYIFPTPDYNDVQAYIGHMTACKCDDNVNNGTEALTKAAKHYANNLLRQDNGDGRWQSCLRVGLIRGLTRVAFWWRRMGWTFSHFLCVGLGWVERYRGFFELGRSVWVGLGCFWGTMVRNLP